jgi:hypothetical protein
MKIILWLHRYLGVAIGLLMVLWCLSGFVMMYQGWPLVTPQERIQGLPPLGPDERRDLSAIPLAEDAALGSFTVEMLGERLALRSTLGAFDLETGAPIQGVDESTARDTAIDFAAAHGMAGVIDRAELIAFDQWSIQERRQGPLWRFHLDGPARAILYVSSTTGQVAQAATGRERLLSWFGAIPHWLYPTVLRQHGGTWTQVVIWTSALGVFLTLTGLYVGIARFRRRPNGRWSPYRKVWLWHHYTGLVFGLLALTWVFSGLLTMGPFGPLQSRPFPEARQIAGEMRWADARAVIQAALARPDSGQIVQIESAPLAGRAFALAHYQDGQTIRLDASGAEALVGDAELRAALEAAGGPLMGASFELLRREDAYHYSLHDDVELPVWRVRTAEENSRLVYLSAMSGRVLRTYDNAGRATRWLMSGLHSFDFPGLRARPVWDIVVLPLLAGVTLLCAIGFWLAIDRVRKDWRMATRRTRTRRASAASDPAQ